MPALATCVAVALLTFAAKRQPPRKGSAASSRSTSGRGFGAAQSPPPPPRKGGKGGKHVPPSPPSGLERKLLEDHGANCAASAAKWTMIGDNDVPGAYAAGWEALAPAPPVAPGANVPYGTDRLILKSRAPLLCETDCAALIQQMESHGALNGWDARYPVTGFTREVNVADIPASVSLLNAALRSTLLPAAAAEFGAFGASTLRVNEALVVKYDAASGNNCLPVHADFSFITVNVALSDAGAFKGGGTWFQHSGETVVAGRGEAVMHAGGIPHCGVPVRSGCRYQLVLFLLSTEHADIAGRLKAIGAAAGAKSHGELMDVALSTAVLERACKANAFDGESWSLLAHNKKHAGDLPAAAKAFEKCLALCNRCEPAPLGWAGLGWVGWVELLGWGWVGLG